jgi:L-threonylcarbamoyladenylate synthase
MRVVAVNPADPRADRITDAAEILRSGGILALPTETLYGLCADALNPGAVARLNPLKQKPASEPILTLLADRGQADQVATELPDVFELLSQTFWPGPLTLVVRAAKSLPLAITGGTGCVAVRVPGLALPRKLAEELGGPITGVSANRYKQAAARNAAEVARDFPEGLDLILDGGTTPAGTASTIVDLTRGRPILLRRGLVSAGSLEPFLGVLETENS